MTNKLLLAAIAAGLWANAIATLIRPAQASGQVESYLSAIEANTRALVTGGEGCNNTKICD